MSLVLRVMMTLSITDSKDTRSSSSIIRQRMAHMISVMRNTTMPSARLASTSARKKNAVKMAQKMNIPIIGLVENMSYLECPDCGKKISVFGESHIDEIAREYNIPVLAKLPIDPKVAEHVDNGTIEYLERDWFDLAAEKAMEL